MWVGQQWARLLFIGFFKNCRRNSETEYSVVISLWDYWVSCCGSGCEHFHKALSTWNSTWSTTWSFSWGTMELELSLRNCECETSFASILIGVPPGTLRRWSSTQGSLDVDLHLKHYGGFYLRWGFTGYRAPHDKLLNKIHVWSTMELEPHSRHYGN